MSIPRATCLLLPLVFSIGCGAARSAPPPPPPDHIGTETSNPSPINSNDKASGPGDSDADDIGDDTDAEDEKKKERDSSASPPPPPPKAAMVEQPLSGSLSQEDIRNIMMKNGALFDDCYKIGADKNQQLVGMVKVQATIGPSGSVTDVKVLKSTVKNPKVDTCVAGAFRKIKFPVPANGATSVITFPMQFEGVQMVQK